MYTVKYSVETLNRGCSQIEYHAHVAFPAVCAGLAGKDHGFLGPILVRRQSGHDGLEPAASTRSWFQVSDSV